MTERVWVLVNIWNPSLFQYGVKISTTCTSHEVDATLYRQLVHSLLYLTHFHPDLSFDIGHVARYMQTPHESHWKEAKRILWYIRGYVFSLGSGPITWAYKKQQALSLSSAKAEYRAAVNSSQEALWLRHILSEFGFKQQQPNPLWCDNQSAINLAKDPVLHQRSKHIEIHMHFMINLVHDRVLEMLYFPIDDQVADIFTKSLIEVKFSKLRSMLGVQECVLMGGYALVPPSFS